MRDPGSGDVMYNGVLILGTKPNDQSIALRSMMAARFSTQFRADLASLRALAASDAALARGIDAIPDLDAPLLGLPGPPLNG